MPDSPLLKLVNESVSLELDEQEEFLSFFTEVKLRKKQLIVQPEFVAQYRYFVIEGSLRTYMVCYQGQEHTIQFAIENYWITDYNSYLFQEPALMFVSALENSTVLRIKYEDEQKLKSLNSKYDTFFRIMAERDTAFMQQRIISNLTDNAEQRYLKFSDKHPEIAYRVPQYALASYLGMTTEYLSRLRNKRTASKT